MCGIAGIFHRREGSPDRRALDAMTDALVHRGPDGRGTFVHDGVGLGHRRLSIIGLSDGAQPMTNEAEDVWVTYNGEIYNYVTLKRELEELGHRFRTGSDTEVLVHGYSAWGPRFVERLRGIFAFTIYDKKRNVLFGARDRLGVKPYFYFETARLFLFGSEPKALLQHPEMPRRPDLDTLHLYMRFGYSPASYAAFEGMRQLEPGCTITVTTDETRIARYWSPPELGVGDPPNLDDELDRRIDETVEIELMSEVPLGAFLSGGIDSSIVSASIAKNPSLTERPSTFTIGFPEPKYDESPHAKRVAESLGLHCNVEVMAIEALDLLDRLVDIYDEPFSDSSAIPTFKLCEMASKHVTVALSGDGGDEVFGGYRRYGKLAGYHQLPGPARNLTSLAARAIPSGIRGQARLQRMSLPMNEQYEHELSMFSRRRIRELCTPELDREVPWSLASLYANAPGSSDVLRAQWVDLNSYLPGDILTKVDRASMACSLEVRVPLLDHEFIGWAASVPAREAFGDGEGKVALKRHLARRVPRELIDRPKMGFGVPLEYWLKGDAGLEGLANQLSSRHPKGEFFSPVRKEAVRALLDEHGHADMSGQIWSVLFLEKWWQKNFV